MLTTFTASNCSLLIFKNKIRYKKRINKPRDYVTCISTRLSSKIHLMYVWCSHIVSFGVTIDRNTLDRVVVDAGRHGTSTPRC